MESAASSDALTFEFDLSSRPLRITTTHRSIIAKLSRVGLEVEHIFHARQHHHRPAPVGSRSRSAAPAAAAEANEGGGTVTAAAVAAGSSLSPSRQPKTTPSSVSPVKAAKGARPARPRATLSTTVPATRAVPKSTQAHQDKTDAATPNTTTTADTASAPPSFAPAGLSPTPHTVDEQEEKRLIHLVNAAASTGGFGGSAAARDYAAMLARIKEQRAEADRQFSSSCFGDFREDLTLGGNSSGDDDRVGTFPSPTMCAVPRRHSSSVLMGSSSVASTPTGHTPHAAILGLANAAGGYSLPNVGSFGNGSGSLSVTVAGLPRNSGSFRDISTAASMRASVAAAGVVGSSGWAPLATGMPANSTATRTGSGHGTPRSGAPLKVQTPHTYQFRTEADEGLLRYARLHQPWTIAASVWRREAARAAAAVMSDPAPASLSPPPVTDVAGLPMHLLLTDLFKELLCAWNFLSAHVAADVFDGHADASSSGEDRDGGNRADPTGTETGTCTPQQAAKDNTGAVPPPVSSSGGAVAAEERREELNPVPVPDPPGRVGCKMDFKAALIKNIKTLNPGVRKDNDRQLTGTAAAAATSVVAPREADANDDGEDEENARDGHLEGRRIASRRLMAVYPTGLPTSIALEALSQSLGPPDRGTAISDMGHGAKSMSGVTTAAMSAGRDKNGHGTDGSRGEAAEWDGGVRGAEDAIGSAAMHSVRSRPVTYQYVQVCITHRGIRVTGHARETFPESFTAAATESSSAGMVPSEHSRLLARVNGVREFSETGSLRASVLKSVLNDALLATFAKAPQCLTVNQMIARVEDFLRMSERSATADGTGNTDGDNPLDCVNTGEGGSQVLTAQPFTCRLAHVLDTPTRPLWESPVPGTTASPSVPSFQILGLSVDVAMCGGENGRDAGHDDAHGKMGSEERTAARDRTPTANAGLRKEAHRRSSGGSRHAKRSRTSSRQRSCQLDLVASVFARVACRRTPTPPTPATGSDEGSPSIPTPVSTPVNTTAAAAVAVETTTVSGTKTAPACEGSSSSTGTSDMLDAVSDDTARAIALTLFPREFVLPANVESSVTVTPLLAEDNPPACHPVSGEMSIMATSRTGSIAAARGPHQFTSSDSDPAERDREGPDDADEKSSSASGGDNGPTPESAPPPLPPHHVRPEDKEAAPPPTSETAGRGDADGAANVAVDTVSWSVKARNADLTDAAQQLSATRKVLATTLDKLYADWGVTIGADAVSSTSIRPSTAYQRRKRCKEGSATAGHGVGMSVSSRLSAALMKTGIEDMGESPSPGTRAASCRGRSSNSSTQRRKSANVSTAVPELAEDLIGAMREASRTCILTLFLEYHLDADLAAEEAAAVAVLEALANTLREQIVDVQGLPASGDQLARVRGGRGGDNNSGTATACTPLALVSVTVLVPALRILWMGNAARDCSHGGSSPASSLTPSPDDDAVTLLFPDEITAEAADAAVVVATQTLRARAAAMIAVAEALTRHCEDMWTATFVPAVVFLCAMLQEENAARAALLEAAQAEQQRIASTEELKAETASVGAEREGTRTASAESTPHTTGADNSSPISTALSKMAKREAATASVHRPTTPHTGKGDKPAVKGITKKATSAAGGVTGPGRRKGSVGGTSTRQARGDASTGGFDRSRVFAIAAAVLAVLFGVFIATSGAPSVGP